MNLLFSPLVLRQLEEIYDYLYQHNPRATARIHNSLLDDIERLTTQPLLGYVELLLEDMAGGYRSLLVGKRYKALYRIHNETVVVITIHDCRRDTARLRKSLS